MDKEEYINLVNDKISNFKTKEIMIRQIDNFFAVKKIFLKHHTYNVGDLVYLKKGTLLHGTYKNID